MWPRPASLDIERENDVALLAPSSDATGKWAERDQAFKPTWACGPP